MGDIKQKEAEAGLLSDEVLEAIRVSSTEHLIDFSMFNNKNYRPSWLHEEIAKQLERVERGEVKRLMIFVPPRHGKSQLASIDFVAWYLGRNPEKNIIACSYSGDLSEDFGFKTRNLISDKPYQLLFGSSLREDSKSKRKWVTQKGGTYIATGVGGVITGRGANILLIDDPIKNREEAESKVIRDKIWSWYISTAYTRLESGESAKDEGSVVLILTRWHTDDLAGRLLKAQEMGGDQWEVVEFPAIATKDEIHRKEGEALWPEKYNLEKLQKIKSVLGTYEFQALYQQNPISSETQEFREETFMYRDMEEILKLDTRRFLSIDTAVSQRENSDYTGFCINFVDTEGKWNIKAWRMRVDPNELINTIFTLHERYNFEKIGIEKTAHTEAIKPFLAKEMLKRQKFLNIVDLSHENIKKEIRIRGLVPLYETRAIFHIKGECDSLEEELLTFPRGTHDDVVDATAYQLKLAEQPYEESNDPFYNEWGTAYRE